MVEATSRIRCPAEPADAEIPGCGSEHVEGPDDEGLYDCLDCGIWFGVGPEATTRGFLEVLGGER